MKRFVVCLFLLSLLLACVPTPKEEIVSQKDFDALIELAQTETVSLGSNPQDDPGATDPAQDGEARYRDAFSGNSDAFTVTVDAQVVRPDGPFPILEVTPDDFDAAKAQPFFDVLTEGFALYTAEELETKTTLEEEIRKLQQFIDDGLPGIEATERQKKKEIKYWQGELEKLKQRYLDAKDEPGTPAKTVEITWAEERKYDTMVGGGFHAQSVDGKQQFYVQTNAVGAHGKRSFDSKHANVRFSNTAVLPDGAILAFHNTEAIADMGAIPEGSGLSVTPRDAQRQAEALIARLGLSGFAVSSVQLVHTPEEADGRTGTPCALYSVRFCRTVNGIPLVWPAFESSSGDEAEPRPAWTYETVEMLFRNTDLYSFIYEGPLVLGNVLVENANLMSFEQAAEKLRQMIRVRYEGMLADALYEDIRSIHVQVDRMELSLERVAQPNNIDGGLLVPVWSFYGSVLCTRDADSYFYGGYDDFPILIFNAVDGTIIDPMKGY